MIPATKEMLRSVTLIETRPSTIAPAKAIHRIAATNSGFTGRLWICRDQSPGLILRPFRPAGLRRLNYQMPVDLNG